MSWTQIEDRCCCGARFHVVAEDIFAGSRYREFLAAHAACRTTPTVELAAESPVRGRLMPRDYRNYEGTKKKPQESQNNTKPNRTQR